MDDTQTNLKSAEEDSLQHARSSRQWAAERQSLDSEINTRLFALTESDNPEIARERFKDVYAKVQSYEAIAQYKKLLKDIETLE